MRLTACRRCGTEVWWGETAKGKHVPVEATRLRFGGKIVALDLEAETPLIRFLKKGEQPPDSAPRWASHLGKCSPGSGSRPA